MQKYRKRFCEKCGFLCYYPIQTFNVSEKNASRSPYGLTFLQLPITMTAINL